MLNISIKPVRTARVDKAHFDYRMHTISTNNAGYKVAWLNLRWKVIVIVHDKKIYVFFFIMIHSSLSDLTSTVFRI